MVVLSASNGGFKGLDLRVGGKREVIIVVVSANSDISRVYISGCVWSDILSLW